MKDKFLQFYKEKPIVVLVVAIFLGLLICEASKHA